LEYLPTRTTDMPEAAAESNARVVPIMPFFLGNGCIKTNLVEMRFVNVVLGKDYSPSIYSPKRSAVNRPSTSFCIESLLGSKYARGCLLSAD
jgi:hypothetical protein